MTDLETALENDHKIYGLLSLSKKAGRVKSGEQMVLEAVSAGQVKLLLIAQDASENTVKRFQDKCAYRGIPTVRFGTMEALGHAIGVSERAGVAVTDAGFAKAIGERLAAKEGSNGKD